MEQSNNTLGGGDSNKTMTAASRSSELYVNRVSNEIETKLLKYGTILNVSWNTEKDEYTEEDLDSIEELPNQIELTNEDVDYINADVLYYFGEDGGGWSIEEIMETQVIKYLESNYDWLVEAWSVE